MNASCQCDRFPGHPCERPITQEDLLCDTCSGRDPKGYTCGAIGGLGSDGNRYHLGLRIDWGRYHAGHLSHDEVMRAVEAVRGPVRARTGPLHPTAPYCS